MLILKKITAHQKIDTTISTKLQITKLFLTKPDLVVTQKLNCLMLQNYLSVSHLFLHFTQSKTIKDMAKIMTFAISEGLAKMGNNQEICQ